MTQRERYIAIGAASAVGLLLLNSVVLTPYTAKLTEVENQTDKEEHSLQETKELVAREHALGPVWRGMTAGGLKVGQYEAQDQAWAAVLSWADWSGVHIIDRKTDAANDADQFQVIKLHATMTATTETLAQLLSALESAPVPIQVTELQLVPRKDGTDDLTVQLSMSTVCLKPPPTPDGRTSLRTYHAEETRS